MAKVAKKTAPRRAAPARNKGRKISVNMEGVTVDGGFHVEPGDYPVKVSEVELKTSENSGNEYINWQLEITDGDEKGKKLFHMTSLQPQALFNLRRTLEAAGMEVPDSVVDIDLDELEGLEFGVAVDDDTYQGQTKSKVVNVFPLENLTAGSGSAETTETEEETLGYADVMAMEKADLAALEKEYSLKIKPGDKKDIDGYRKAVAAGLGLEEEAVEEESEEITREDVLKMSKDQLDELVEQFELKIDPKFHKLLPKYREKVAEGLGLDE